MRYKRFRSDRNRLFLPRAQPGRRAGILSSVPRRGTARAARRPWECRRSGSVPPAGPDGPDLAVRPPWFLSPIVTRPATPRRRAFEPECSNHTLPARRIRVLSRTDSGGVQRVQYGRRCPAQPRRTGRVGTSNAVETVPLRRGDRRRRPTRRGAQDALKSSGETLSRNSLNFSTSSSRTGPEPSSSDSSGMNSPASASTASST